LCPPGGKGCSDGLFDLKQQRGERLGPDRLGGADLLDEEEFAEQVGVAEAVAALLEARVGEVAVSDERAPELRTARAPWE